MKKQTIVIMDGALPTKSKKFLVINHSRKTFHFSTSPYCYREDDKDGKEVTWPSEKFDVYSGKEATKNKIPKGYRDDMKENSIFKK